MASVNTVFYLPLTLNRNAKWEEHFLLGPYNCAGVKMAYFTTCNVIKKQMLNKFKFFDDPTAHCDFYRKNDTSALYQPNKRQQFRFSIIDDSGTS